LELGLKLELGALIILRTRTKPEPRSWLFKNQNWDLGFLRTGTRTEILVFWKLEPESDLGIDSYMTEARSKSESKKVPWPEAEPRPKAKSQREARAKQELKAKKQKQETKSLLESQARVKSQKQKQETKSWSEKWEIEAKKWEIETWETEARNERQMQKMRDRHEKWKTYLCVNLIWSLRLIFCTFLFL
jgi:hypothetical protein